MVKCGNQSITTAGPIHIAVESESRGSRSNFRQVEVDAVGKSKQQLRLLVSSLLLPLLRTLLPASLFQSNHGLE